MSNGYVLNALRKKKPNGARGNYYIMIMFALMIDCKEFDCKEYLRKPEALAYYSNLDEAYSDVQGYNNFHIGKKAWIEQVDVK